MPVPVQFEKQIRSILKNVADIRKFVAATTVYYSESTAFLKSMMEKTGMEYNTDIENIKLPFQDETLRYAFSHLITLLLQYEQSSGFLAGKLAEFDQHTARQLSAVFDREESDKYRHQVINEIVENIESLVEEKNILIKLTMDIEQTIKQVEIRLSAYFN